jgi:hypothetical protein
VVSQVRRLPFDGEVQVVELTLDSETQASQECVAALQKVAQQNAQRPVKLRVITRLVTEVD